MRIACLAIGLLCTALAHAEVLYRLPWPEGLSFMFSQAPGGRVTSHFTQATLHAVDIAMPQGVPILAARGGVVEALESSHGASPEEEPITYEGNYVRVRHADGTVAVYAHLRHASVVVAVRDAVAPAQLLGHSGASGDAPYSHLHFAVLKDDKSLPIRFYVGVPAVAFSPRAALRVTANYSGPAEPPRAPSEGSRMIAWKRPALGAADETTAWEVLGLWLVCGIAAVAWFWRFSRE